MPTRATTYRDVTLSRDERDDLHPPAAQVDVLATVVQRWDENDATEVEFPA